MVIYDDNSPVASLWGCLDMLTNVSVPMQRWCDCTATYFQGMLSGAVYIGIVLVILVIIIILCKKKQVKEE